MQRLATWLLLLLGGCSSGYEQGAPTDTPFLAAKHFLPAFGGELSGVDDGEFGGALYYKERDGTIHKLIDQNVRGIVKNEAGIFVFTGLTHLGSNWGYLYSVSETPNQQVTASLLGRLPGSPGQLEPTSSGATSFLVYTGRYSHDKPVYDCYALSGNVVARSSECRPLKGGL